MDLFQGKKSWKKDEENKNISKAILFPAFFASFQTAREGENYFQFSNNMVTRVSLFPFGNLS